MAHAVLSGVDFVRPNDVINTAVDSLSHTLEVEVHFDKCGKRANTRVSGFTF